MKNTDLHIKILLSEMLDCITKDSSIKLWCLYLVQHMLHQIKAPKFYTDLVLHREC